MPILEQMRRMEDALGLDPDNYTPLARMQSMLPRIRTCDVDPKHAESEEEGRNKAAVLSRSEPPLLGPLPEQVSVRRGQLNPWNIDPVFCPP